MKKILLAFLVLTQIIFAKVITDQLGRKVEIPDVVNKIVTLQHQSLNVLVQIGASDKIVGVLDSWEKNLDKDYARLFPNIVNLPKPGGLKTVNFESILALKPDVVIVANYLDKSYVEKLESLNIPVVMMSFFKAVKSGENSVNPEFDDEMFSYDTGLKEGILLLGNIANKDENAKNLVKYIEDSQNELKKYTSKLTKKVRLYMANPKYQTYGKGKYTNIIFSRSGGVNVAAADIKGYKTVSPEMIISWNPDVIFVQSRYKNVIDELKNDDKLKNLKAIKDNKIFLMPEYAKAWGYPTPEAMSIGEFWVAKKLYPDILKDFDLDKKVNEYYEKFYNFKYDGK